MCKFKVSTKTLHIVIPQPMHRSISHLVIKIPRFRLYILVSYSSQGFLWMFTHWHKPLITPVLYIFPLMIFPIIKIKTLWRKISIKHNTRENITIKVFMHFPYKFHRRSLGTMKSLWFLIIINTSQKMPIKTHEIVQIGVRFWVSKRVQLPTIRWGII